MNSANQTWIHYYREKRNICKQNEDGWIVSRNIPTALKVAEEERKDQVHKYLCLYHNKY